MREESVLYGVDDRGVARITINRPERHNAFDDVVIAALLNAVDRAAANTAVRVVVLQSAGSSFSAGADLAWMKRAAQFTPDDNQRDAQGLSGIMRRLNELPIPTLARVQGPAYGGAVGLASCCDIVIATPRASFALSEVKLGLVPAVISPYVVAAIGARAARRYFLTGERFGAAVAQQLGLVSEIVAEEELDATVDRFINLLLDNGPGALTAAKKLIRDVAGRPITDDLERMTSELIAGLRKSPEGQEGLGAFLEKRAPAWKR